MRIEDWEQPKSVDEVRTRWNAFERWFAVGGGRRGQEIADIAFLLGKIEKIKAMALWSDDHRATLSQIYDLLND